MYRISLKEKFNLKDNDLVISFISVLSGLLCGAVIFMLFAEGIKEEILDLFINFYTVYTNKTSLEIFSGIALYGLFYFTVMFILGGSFFGTAVSPIVTFIKSAGLTLLISDFYCEYTLKGLEYTLLVFFPGKCILVFAMLLMTKNCIGMSRKMIHCDRDTQTENIVNYCIKSFIILIIFIFSWIVDFGCIKVFSDLFDFK